jgi:hypothetical protein
VRALVGSRELAAHAGKAHHVARIMLDFLLAHKVAIGRMLSVIGATATVVIFEYSFASAWYVSIPAGALAYVTMPIMWTALLDHFAARTRP